jgi:hypothetical protein
MLSPRGLSAPRQFPVWIVEDELRMDDNIIPVKGVIPIDQLFGDDEEDTRLLQAMALYARGYIQEFAWCKSVKGSYFGDGVGAIVGVFLFHIEPAQPNIHEWLWVVVGDIPPTYLVIDDNTTPSLALQSYIDEMSKWIKLVKSGKSTSKAIPVNRPATKENALLLEDRLKAIEEMILPRFQDAETERA